MSRFDYVKYDEKAIENQEALKIAFVAIDGMVEDRVVNGRAKALVFTKLEEAYMWIGKAIRDEQLERNKYSELQEGRKDS